MHFSRFLCLGSAAWAAASVPDAFSSVWPRGAELTQDQIESQDFWEAHARIKGISLCVLWPDSKGGDDAPAIQKAFTRDCHNDSLVVFPGSTYHIKSPMTTTGLENVFIEQFGRFLWSDDIDYWLERTMPIGFQNQSTVWYFGGDRVLWNGHGRGTFDGNGQTWYDWAKSRGNLAHRPMNINWRHLTNSKISGLRFVQSQMWSMATSWCVNVEFEDIYVKSVSNSQWSTLNTDGIDTINSDRITLRRWSVRNGDDGIALKGNSTNISIYDSEIWSGQGMALGSVGQYDKEYELVENFHASNITLHNTTYAIYLKTWGGESRSYPPNGGGGGLGQMRNITVENIVLDQSKSRPLFLWQCENYEGSAGKDCNTSKFGFHDITFRNISGSVIPSDHEYAGWFQCSKASGGCDDFKVSDYSVKTTTGRELTDWYCTNMNDHSGFNCTSKSSSSDSGSDSDSGAVHGHLQPTKVVISVPYLVSTMFLMAFRW